MSGCPQNLLQGQAGVWRVASELALRGFTPHFPGVDFGYDIMIEAGVRIQVKCAHLSFRRPYPKGAYWFKLAKGAIVSGSNTIKKRLTQVFSEKSEFVILWGIEQQRFWIVPSGHLDNHQLVVVGPDVGHRALDMGKVKALHAEGRSQEWIARELGVQQMTISRRLRGLYVEAQRATSQKVRECEGRWVQIQECVDLAHGVESIESFQETTSQET